MIGMGSRKSWGEELKPAIIKIFFGELLLYNGQRNCVVTNREYMRGVLFCFFMEDIAIYYYAEGNDPVTKENC